MAAPADEPRAAFVAHCFLNQNAKVAEFARCPGAVLPVVQALRQHGWELAQLPCPEMSHLGAGRWWQSREMYDTPGYRDHCRRLAGGVVTRAQRYLQEGDRLILVGIDGSPSSGIRLTNSKPAWGGRPEAAPLAGSTRVPGRGIWIQELAAAFEAVGLDLPRATGLMMESADFVLETAMAEFEEFLREAQVPA